MALAKRERYFAIGVGVLVGLFAVDSFWFSPMLERLDKANLSFSKGTADSKAARQLLDNKDRAGLRWAEITRGTMKDDASAAEAQVLNAMRDYAQSAELSLVALKPERTEKEKGFGRITIRATATGTMAQVSRFLFSLRTAAIPVSVNDVTIASRKDGADDLTLQLGVSSLYNDNAPPALRPAGTVTK